MVLYTFTGLICNMVQHTSAALHFELLANPKLPQISYQQESRIQGEKAVGPLHATRYALLVWQRRRSCRRRFQVLSQLKQDPHIRQHEFSSLLSHDRKNLAMIPRKWPFPLGQLLRTLRKQQPWISSLAAN